MNLLIELAFIFAYIAGIVFVVSLVCLFEAVEEFKKLFKDGACGY